MISFPIFSILEDCDRIFLMFWRKNAVYVNIVGSFEIVRKIENPVYIVEKDESVCKLEWVSDNKRKQYVNCYIHIENEY